VNKSLAIFVAVGLALGCDDPAVRDAIDAVLDNGVIKAQALCDVDAATVDTGNPGNIGCGVHARLDIQQHIDGSASVTVRNGDHDVGSMRVIPRASADADDLRTVFGDCSCDSKISFHVDSGELVFVLSDKQGSCPDVPSPQTFASLDIETECTGFNLEAFE
jgi:hypothetical protein